MTLLLSTIHETLSHQSPGRTLQSFGRMRFSLLSLHHYPMVVFMSVYSSRQPWQNSRFDNCFLPSFLPLQFRLLFSFVPKVLNSVIASQASSGNAAWHRVGATLLPLNFIKYFFSFSKGSLCEQLIMSCGNIWTGSALRLPGLERLQLLRCTDVA